jgi:serine/threonine protein kinase
MDGRQGPNFNNKPGESVNDRSGSGRSARSGNGSQNLQSGEPNEVDLPPSFQMGDTIGGTYSVVSFLGRGGMGQVFGVEHMMLRQTYALKILTSDSPSTVSWRRFQTEARTIAKLDHPNIIKVHNLGIHNDRVPYYVMELLDGETLSSLFRRQGPLNPATVIDLFIPMCDGLAYAHSHGIVHRDIKPSNIMLVSRNHIVVPKLVDFGLVKLVGNAISPSQQLTNTGEVFGSPLYMSPEQSVGRHINERSDIYSLGCTMFEALAGSPPFVGENIVQTILKHQNEEPPTLKQASMGLDFSPEWEAVMKRVLAKEASDRYQTMDELANDLRAIKDGKRLRTGHATTGGGDLFSEEEEKKRVLAKGKLLVLVSLGVMCLLALMGTGGYFYLKQQKKAPVHVDPLAYNGIQAEQAVTVTPAAQKDLENISLPFVQNGGKPINGFRVYKFPTDIIIGSFEVNYMDLTKKSYSIDASGEIKVPVDGLIAFQAGNKCGDMPKIFRKFLPGDFVSIALPGGATDTTDQLHYLDHLTNLQALNLDGTDVTPAALKIIEAMPHLTGLSLAHTRNLTGADLAQLKTLPQMERIIFRGGKDVSPLLQALKGSMKIRQLCLDGVKLSPQDIKLITTMHGLEDLSLNCCGLTDDALAPLNSLPRMGKLSLRGNDFSSKFIDIFKDKKSLVWLTMSNPKWSEHDLARFKQIFAHRYVFRDIQDFNKE